MYKLILFCWLLIALPAWAHNGVIKVRVIDKGNQQPLAGAIIELTEKQLVRTTNAVGECIFSEIESGEYSLSVFFLGYKKITQTAIVKDNAPSEILCELEMGSIDLKEVALSSADSRKLNIINAVDINLRPVNNAQDFLRVVPGLFIAQHAGGGKAEQIFLRGFDIDHGTDISLHVDGMPVNMPSHAHGQGYADLHFLIPELVNQVSFEKGTYYAQKGNFATAGFVDFQTAQALDKSTLKIEGGQFGTLRTVAMLDLLGETLKKNGQSAYIAGEFLNSRGYFDSPQGLKRLNLLAKYQHQLDKNNILTLSFAHFKSSWDASGQIPERAVKEGMIGYFGAIDNTEGGQTSRSSLDFKLVRLLNNGGILKNQIYAIQYDFELYSNFTFFLQNPLYGDQIRQKENRNIIGYNTQYTQTHTWGKIHAQTDIGGNIRYDMVNDVELTRTFGRKKVLENVAWGDVHELNSSLYAQETIDLTSQLSVNIGARLDYFQFEYINKLDSTYLRNSKEKILVSPKLSLTYDLNNAIRLYAKSGYGFHSNDSRTIVSQSEVLPKALGFDLGIVLKPIPQLILQSALWNLYLEQEFVYVGDEGIVEPSGKTNRRGIDFSARYQATDWLFIDTDFNFTQPKALYVPSNENKIPLAPTFTSIGGVSLKFNNGLYASLRYRYLADRPANEDNSLTAKGYNLFDAVLRYQKPSYTFAISIENILNQKWKEAQFATETRLSQEIEPVTEIHFTPGTPFFLKASMAYSF